MAGGSLAREEYPGAAPRVPAEHAIEALELAAPQCRGCELYHDATQVVMGRGQPDPGSCWWASSPGTARTGRGKRSSDRPAVCS